MKQIHFKISNKLMLLMVVIALLSISFKAKAQISEKSQVSLDKANLWTAKQLIEPLKLAAILTNKKAKKPVIFNIGVVEDIQGAKNVGAASKEGNLKELKHHLSKLPKSSEVIIYCGCCPFEKCPNIRPAFTLMNDMGFSKGKLLNIPVNLKQNWINKGYPMQ